MENNHPIFNIKLTFDQVSVILSTMGKLPYENISTLMNSIQTQANTQLQEYQMQQPEQNDHQV